MTPNHTAVPHRVDCLSGGVWVSTEPFPDYYAAADWVRQEYGGWQVVDDGLVALVPLWDEEEG